MVPSHGYSRIGGAERQILSRLEPVFGALETGSTSGSTTVYVALRHKSLNSEEDRKHRPQILQSLQYSLLAIEGISSPSCLCLNMLLMQNICPDHSEDLLHGNLLLNHSPRLSYLCIIVVGEVLFKSESRQIKRV